MVAAEHRKSASKMPLIVGIPIAALLGAAVAYGTMCNTVDTNKSELADLKPRLAKAEISIGELNATLKGFSRQLDRIENKLDGKK